METFEVKPIREVIDSPETLKLWLAVGCAACSSYDLKEGCTDQHGLCLYAGLRCKWCRWSKDAFVKFLAECNFSALQKEVLLIQFDERR